MAVFLLSAGCRPESSRAILLNLDTKPYIALLVEVKDAASTTPSADEAAIRAARDSFNAAIERGDVPAIASALADNAQMVTGNDSVLYAGKPAQVAIWAQDLKDPSRGIYVRTPDRIEVSPLAPMALETGHWKGVDSKSASDWASGVYSAKWRRTGGKWLIESETFMTTACAGKYCPTKRWERASASTKPFLLGFRLLHAGRCDSSAPLRPRRHPLARAALLRFSVPVAPRIPSRKVTK
jgi:ketosteroid isomerase-like protein